MFRPQAQAKGVAFTHERAKNLPAYVRTDEKRLRQILVNLISNALKFTDAGEIRLDVAYRSQVATFTVADSGRGILEKDISRIFEPFQRGDAEHGRMPGLGLGLTITRLLTQTLGGEISVTSERGKGTAFRVRLMLSAVDRPTAPKVRHIKGYAGARRTILVVDDNADHRNLMEEVLRPLDFTVLTAKGGAECLDLVEGLKPDLFLIDISMPGMNGWELVERLRALGQAAPIVMLSANIGDGSASRTGHNDTLAKPFDLRQLTDTLALHLGLAWTYHGEAKAQEPAEASIVMPEKDHVDELIRLGEIGYIRGIEAKLAEIARVAEHQPFAEAVRAYVQVFDLAGYDAFLKTMDPEKGRRP
jgi:CheY-like chemotaxis protein/anti-sigma regulatory factor (Ser/Thr protein kinase)